MKLPERGKLKKKSTKKKKLNEKSQAVDLKPKKRRSRAKKISWDDLSFRLKDHRDSNYCYFIRRRFFYRRNRSNEILINVITNKIDPKSIKNVNSLVKGINIAKKHIALDYLLTEKFIKCHLSTCIKKMNLSIQHYLRIKSNLMFQVNIARFTHEKWFRISKNVNYTEEELGFIRSLVKNAFEDMGLMADWDNLVAEYEKDERLKYFRIHEEHLFQLNVVQRGTEEVKIKENSLLDLRSNLSVFSRAEDFGNIDLDRHGTRSRLNSFSDSKSLSGSFRGLENFNFF